MDGEDGIDGEDGVDGEDGDDGVDGIDGTDGIDATLTGNTCSRPSVAVVGATPTISAGTCAAPTPNAVNGGVQISGLPAAVSVTATSRGTTATTWDVKLANTGGNTDSQHLGALHERNSCCPSSAQPQPDERHGERDHRQRQGSQGSLGRPRERLPPPAALPGRRGSGASRSRPRPGAAPSAPALRASAEPGSSAARTQPR